VQVTHCQSTHISDVVWYRWLILGTFLSPAHRFSHCTDLCIHYNGYGWPLSVPDVVPGSDHIMDANYTSHTATETERECWRVCTSFCVYMCEREREKSVRASL